MPGSETIEILLATYNGAARLDAQLASIAAQSHGDWRLLARDDGSTDATPARLRAFAEAHPGRVTLLEDRRGNLGARGNFGALLEAVRAPYAAFADQDDLWRPHRLATGLAEMRALEADHGARTPLMVVTDRRVIDAEGREIAPSHWRLLGHAPETKTGLADFLALPVAPGNSMLVNAALAARAAPIPAAALMHDTWVELVAWALGRARYLPEVTVDHIRHGGNVTASRRYGPRRYLRRAVRLAGNLARHRGVYRRFLAQGAALLARHGEEMAPADRAALARFVALGEAGALARARAVRREGYFTGWERKLAFVLLGPGRG